MPDNKNTNRLVWAIAGGSLSCPPKGNVFKGTWNALRQTGITLTVTLPEMELWGLGQDQT